MRKLLLLFTVLFILDCLAIPLAADAQSPEEPVVQAILFRSPTCPACHQVIDELLSPMAGDYGKRLQIVGIDTSQSAGLKLYRATVERYQIPRERQGVPTLVIGDVELGDAAAKYRSNFRPWSKRDWPPAASAGLTSLV